jgi:hypothetical protein
LDAQLKKLDTELQQKGVDLSTVQESAATSAAGQGQLNLSLEDYLLSDEDEEMFLAPPSTARKAQVSSSSVATHKAAQAAAQAAAASSGMLHSSHILSTPTPSAATSSSSSRQARKRRKTTSVQKEFAIPLTLPKQTGFQQHQQQQQALHDNGEDDGTDQNTVYCFCRQVSYGDMVGCDSEVFFSVPFF